MSLSQRIMYWMGHDLDDLRLGASNEAESRAIWTTVIWLRWSLMVPFLCGMTIAGTRVQSDTIDEFICTLVVGLLLIFMLSVPAGIAIGSIAYFLVGSRSTFSSNRMAIALALICQVALLGWLVVVAYR